MKVTIEAYKYEDLDQKSQFEVLAWLDEWPIEYEDENGETHLEYFADMTKEDVSELCEVNEYLFNKFGKPIHHLIIE